ncbi:MAG: hypothetical protein GY829_15610 [Gammaproteobacteria bacterium]|nr:hypothetical protein [Gammaproteobacteria bacterium]
MKSIRHVNTYLIDGPGSEDYFYQRRDDILLIASQETLNDDFLQLKKLLDLNDSINLPSSSIDVHKRPETMGDALSDLAISNIKKWYHTDYLMLEVGNKLMNSKYEESSD